MLTAGSQAEVLGSGPSRGSLAVGLAAAAAVVPVAWRRHAPLVVLGLVLAGVSVMGLLEPRGE